LEWIPGDVTHPKANQCVAHAFPHPAYFNEDKSLSQLRDLRFSRRWRVPSCLHLNSSWRWRLQGHYTASQPTRPRHECSIAEKMSKSRDLERLLLRKPNHRWEDNIKTRYV